MRMGPLVLFLTLGEMLSIFHHCISWELGLVGPIPAPTGRAWPSAPRIWTGPREGLAPGSNPRGTSLIGQCSGVASVLSDSATPWTVARQAPLSMGFSRQEHEWVARPSSRASSRLRDQPTCLRSPALAGGFCTTSHLGSLIPSLKSRICLSKCSPGPDTKCLLNKSVKRVIIFLRTHLLKYFQT